MISEVSNALLFTYLATEYLANSSHRHEQRSLLTSRVNVIVLVFVTVINLIDRVAGFSLWINSVLNGILHAPRIAFVAIAYVAVLYIDCLRLTTRLSFTRDFLPVVSSSFLYVLPVYPFLAVLISFVFMFVIRLFELLRIPLAYLNMPIYYGTLYGPFSVVYHQTKQRLSSLKYNLPS